MDYELFHDESRKDGYWHGMLLVPIAKKQQLLALLQLARGKTGYVGNKTFKEMFKTGNHFDCMKSWMQITLLAMQTQKFSSEMIDWGRSCSTNRFQKLGPENIGVKFILFREVDHFNKMYEPLDFAKNVEITFRIGLKGGLHFLGSEDQPINIEKIHFDNHEHYRRHISYDRIIGKLNGLRNYVTISANPNLIDDRSGKTGTVNSQSAEDCEFLLLTDLLIGGFRSALVPQDNPQKKTVSQLPAKLLQRYFMGLPRMKNSRWFSSLCISQCFIENGHWSYETIDIQREESAVQKPLFEF